jgi:serine/threonine-protein kinase
MIGRIIGNYRITSELAHGGMGTVYRGQHVHLPREIVVKSILLTAFSPSAQSHLKARFRREAYIQSQLDHPNIVRVYEFFTAEDNYYLVMEYVPGMSLRELLSRQGVPTPAQAVYLCKQALSALDYAHNFSYVDESDLRHTGIIHRDIKPANMLLDNKGKLKITDFGIVKVLGEQGASGGMTQTGFHPGTVEYMSPEQLLGLDIDVRSDLYSLGVTFYEMLCGRLPFVRSTTGSDWEVRKGHIEVEPPPILGLRPDLPPTLAAIIMRSLRKSPNERFQTASEFLEALQIHERTIGDAPARGMTGRMTKPIAPSATAMDEAVTLISKSSAPPASPSSPGTTGWPSAAPSSSSGPLMSPSGASLEEAATMPISQVGANSSHSPDIVGTSARASSNSNPTNEETIVVSRRGSSKSRLGLAATGVGLLLAGTAAGAYFFSGGPSRNNLQSAAAKPEPTVTAATPTPTSNPTATPKPTVKPKPSPTAQAVTISPTPAVQSPPPAKSASNLLVQAKALEDQEQYDEAIAKYSEFQRTNPASAESGLAIGRINILSNVKRLLNEAQAAMQAGRYVAARERYRTAMQLKPNSQTARAGFAEARAKASNQMNAPRNRPYPPPEGEPPPEGQGRRRKFPKPIPDPQRQP